MNFLKWLIDSISIPCFTRFSSAFNTCSQGKSSFCSFRVVARLLLRVYSVCVCVYINIYVYIHTCIYERILFHKPDTPKLTDHWIVVSFFTNFCNQQDCWVQRGNMIIRAHFCVTEVYSIKTAIFVNVFLINKHNLQPQ